MAASARVWLDAARPATLPAALSPVLVGTAIADAFVPWRALAALIVALAFQVAVNFANDYQDATRGVDTAERTGPRRAVASGTVSAAAMRNAAALAVVIACAAGLALAATVSWWLIAVGAFCALAAWAYSGGPRPYASAGLGEAFVFVCFGLVATVGSAFVHDAAVPPAAWPAAVAMGLLASAILVANNLRDLPTDEAAGKRTLAVRLGDRPTRWLYVALLTGAFVCLPFVAWLAGEWQPLIALVVGLQAVLPSQAVLTGGQSGRGAAGSELVPILMATARLQLLVALLVTLGFMLAA
ncbi:1,4-dihydroxy-2-naphthoate polyprenyltransferase [Egibacter rhizosphaerae]|uniref:1,4-dihydroxy-2-naphthoate polyprenyltransferase n=1 Tax=Egibacter rhizosphaerae TaxID=1670831 RepID=UPI00197AE04E|nr:1,4-dihydroxy-2-naphthoate polyprenyltransferase [Egibacter rhizosphaerae]